MVPAKMDNFDKKTRLEIDSLGQPYDYDSIMHYRKVCASVKHSEDNVGPPKYTSRVFQSLWLTGKDVTVTSRISGG